MVFKKKNVEKNLASASAYPERVTREIGCEIVRDGLVFLFSSRRSVCTF